MTSPLSKAIKPRPHPQLILDEPTLRVVYAPSQYFASEPKADISLVLRNPQAMDSARRQVMFALNDYLAGIALDQLSNRGRRSAAFRSLPALITD